MELALFQYFVLLTVTFTSQMGYPKLKIEAIFDESPNRRTTFSAKVISEVAMKCVWISVTGRSNI